MPDTCASRDACTVCVCVCMDISVCDGGALDIAQCVHLCATFGPSSTKFREDLLSCPVPGLGDAT